jgi:hypothetical protein
MRLLGDEEQLILLLRILLLLLNTMEIIARVFRKVHSYFPDGKKVKILLSSFQKSAILKVGRENPVKSLAI